MRLAHSVLRRLDSWSDWLSPILVKEVRQLVRAREFISSFAAVLIAGVGIAFFGAAEALAGSGTSGRWSFGALMTCLSVVGLAVVPLGAFGALRNERLEQTLDLITLTALSPRRIVVGKLLAQAVKLLTLFAAMAPFLAMSFLLGGIDFVSILVSLAVLFMWSLWVCAACLFLSTLLRSRVMFGLVFGAIGLVLLVGFGMARSIAFSVSFGITSPMGAPSFWWALAISTTVCLMTLVNLVLLAEHRLSLATENRVAPLRLGFLAQLLLLVVWMLTFLGEPPRVKSNAVDALGFLGAVHLAVVAMFAATERLSVPRRVLRTFNARMSSVPRALLAFLRPGAGAGALYVLVQMVAVLGTAWLLEATWTQLRWQVAAFGFVLFFTGVPAVAFHWVKPRSWTSLHLRVGILLLFLLSLLLPDVLHYLIWQPDVLRLEFGARHLVNPLRSLANWRVIEAEQWFTIPAALGLLGFLAYGVLIVTGAQLANEQAATERQRAPAPEEADSANVLY